VAGAPGAPHPIAAASTGGWFQAARSGHPAQESRPSPAARPARGPAASPKGGLGYEPIPPAAETAEPTPELAEAPTDAHAPTAAELRARRIAELAGYGPDPANLAKAIPYAVRVMMRKRELDLKLDALGATCARADAAAEQALADLGEALFALRGDPRLEPLAARADKIAGALRLSEEVSAAAQGDAEGAQQALKALAPRIAQVEAEVAELQQVEAQRRAKYEASATRLRQTEALHARVVQAIQALQAKPPVDRVRLAALASEREARNAERRYLEVQIGPMETELGEAQRELAAGVEALRVVQAQQTAIHEAAGRTRASREASLAAAHGMQHAALVGLARAALMADMAGFAGEAAEAADDALARARALRDEEDLYKRARDSYDEDAYQRGLGILVGGSVLAFVVLAGLILF
jgi:hypothetical protein